MRDRAVSLLTPTSPPLVLGIVVAGLAVGAATAVLSIAAFDFFHLWLAAHGRLALGAAGGLSMPGAGLGLWAAAIELGAAVGCNGRVRERVVASVQALLCAARERGGMGSAVER